MLYTLFHKNCPQAKEHLTINTLEIIPVSGFSLQCLAAATNLAPIGFYASLEAKYTIGRSFSFSVGCHPNVSHSYMLLCTISSIVTLLVSIRGSPSCPTSDKRCER